MEGFFSVRNLAATAAITLLVTLPVEAQNATPDFQSNNVAWVAMN